MSAVVSTTLPYPPSANKLWRFVPGNRTPLKSREYRDWQAAADRCIVMADRGLIRDDSDTQKISIEWAPDEPSARGVLVTVTAA